MTQAWKPLSERGTTGDIPLVDGTPPYLYRPLQQWLYHVLARKPGAMTTGRSGHENTETQQVMIRLRMESPVPWMIDSADPRFLDAIDATLHWTDWEERLRSPHEEGPSHLERTLAAANSAWRVAASGRGLERRLDETVTAAALTTIDGAGETAADHLREAWDHAYGRNPNPDTAYREAVLAVEAALVPITLPINPRARLGLARDHLRDASRKWELVLPNKDAVPASVDVLVSMLTALEEGQRSRHAGTPTARRQTLEESQAAVHLAMTIVQWISARVLVSKP